MDSFRRAVYCILMLELWFRDVFPSMDLIAEFGNGREVDSARGQCVVVVLDEVHL